MATNNETSALLALPVELVSRIANSLEPESLLMLRLTCKVLEHSTYDLFAKTFFEKRFCCIYYEPRWLLMKAVMSSRLGSRVREVTFTLKPLESKRYGDLQLAPNKFERDLRSAQSIAENRLSAFLGLQTQVPALPSTAILSRVFRDFKRLAPSTLIGIDFFAGSVPRTNLMAPLVETDVLVAAVTAGVAIDKLKLSVQDTHLLKDVLVHLGSELTASTKSLTCFQLEASGSYRGDYDTQFVTTILDSTDNLRELMTIGRPGRSTTTAILREKDFTQLTSLHIMGFGFAGEDLVAGLQVCHSMLHLTLSDVKLIGGDTSWPSVFRALASLLDLHDLGFHALRCQASDRKCLVFRGMVHGRTNPDGSLIRFEGKEQTAAGLEELIATLLIGEHVDHPYLLGIRDQGVCCICGYGTVVVNKHLL